ncbi:hypothetical protein OH492_13870 [Vibrio chagasii]|nr:hypothetical protein [Vibrio chagasii]
MAVLRQVTIPESIHSQNHGQTIKDKITLLTYLLSTGLYGVPTKRPKEIDSEAYIFDEATKQFIFG